MEVYTKKVEREKQQQLRMKLAEYMRKNSLKVCAKCKQIKPISTFGTDKTHKNGLQSWCRSCKAGWARQYYRSKKQIEHCNTRRCPHCGKQVV